MIRHVAFVAFVLISSGCSDDSSATPSPDLAKSTATDRFLGTWPSCTFGRRLEFTTPSGTPARAMNDIAGSLNVTDNGNDTIKMTPTATGITNCALDFTRNGATANIVPNQTCTDEGLVLTFGSSGTVDVSTSELAGSFVVSFSGTYLTQPASGTGGGVYHCNAR